MMAAVMTHYHPVDRRTPIGTSQDFGPGKVLARVVNASGHYVSLGFHEDRRAARLAIETEYRNGARAGFGGPPGISRA
jgi:hypothetical protein